jgi:hypothetical protein
MVTVKRLRGNSGTPGAKVARAVTHILRSNGLTALRRFNPKSRPRRHIDFPADVAIDDAV